MDFLQLNGDGEELPAPIREIFARLKTSQAKIAAGREIINKARGRVEADVLTPAFDTMRNDPNVTTHELMAAIAALHAVIKAYEKSVKHLGWWATAHVAKVSAAYLAEQHLSALAIAAKHEDIDPGSTTETGDMDLPGGDS